LNIYDYSNDVDLNEKGNNYHTGKIKYLYNPIVEEFWIIKKIQHNHNNNGNDNIK